MHKKRKSGGGTLGKALIRDRFGPSRGQRANSMLHTSELNDGYDWGRLNLQSVTEESSFQEFLSTAELAGTEFHAEKLNIKFVNPKAGIGLLSQEEKQKLSLLQAEKRELLKIPRRPKWDSSTTAEELQTKEKESFLEWRRGLAFLQETESLMLTPYEKNLEFWRQLWRVVERSDVIVQIVDARNPLLFRCEDLEKYVKEVDPTKMNMILINKADFLTESQRQAWADYFSAINVKVAFFSAIQTPPEEILHEESKEGEDKSSDDELEEESDKEDTEYFPESTGDEQEKINLPTQNIEENDDDDNENSMYNSDFASDSEYESAEEEPCNNVNDNQKFEEEKSVDTGQEKYELNELKTSIEGTLKEASEVGGVQNSSALLTRDQLVSLFKKIYTSKTHTEGITTIGLVGYPNVGKSSTINSLLMAKKVSVSATPGKTKHFQTLFLDKDLLLCDCPGLVMPSFVSTKAEMILNGILPIDQMKDHVPPITLLGTLIPKHVIEDTYGIMIAPPSEGEDPDRNPIAEEILNPHGFIRGFMTQNGQPDNSRSSRYLLKDFVNGKLLYCVAPPTVPQEEYHTFPPRQRKERPQSDLPPAAMRAHKAIKVTVDDVDKVFFRNTNRGVHIRGKTGVIPQSINPSDSGSTLGSTQSLLIQEKPWKQINKHKNKNKREKGRRVYNYLDLH